MIIPFVLPVSVKTNSIAAATLNNLRYSNVVFTKKFSSTYPSRDYVETSGKIVFGDTKGRTLALPRFICVPIGFDFAPEFDETFTAAFEEDSEDPQYRWTFTVTIKDDDPERIPNVALEVDEHIITISTNFGRLVETSGDS